MNLHVRPGVFVPRWETEEWTIALASRLRRLTPSRHTFTVVDLCTGSGCIPLFLKSYISANIDKTLYATYGKPNKLARFVGIDKSPLAMNVARRNLNYYRSPDELFPDAYYPQKFHLTSDRSISYNKIFTIYHQLHFKAAWTSSHAIRHTFPFPPLPPSTDP